MREFTMPEIAMGLIVTGILILLVKVKYDSFKNNKQDTY